MADHSTTRRTLLAGTLSGSALRGVAPMTFRAQNADGSLATPVVVRVDYLKNVVR